MRSAVLATPVQKRCPAKNDRRSFRTWAEQHRQHAEKHIVADDEVGREVLQSVLQAIVLGSDIVDKQSLDGDAYPFRSGRNGLEGRSPREHIVRIEIRIRGERTEFRSAAFDPATQCGPGQAGDLVAFSHQDARDCKQRIEMTGRGSRCDENFHGILSSDSRRRTSGLSGYPPADWLKQDKSAGIAVTLRLLTGANLLRLQC